MIGQQEVLDLLLESIEHIVSQRQDIHFGIIGGGTELESIKKLASQMALNDYITFYGRVEDEILLEILNTADVCVNPDRPTVMNDLSTMNKIMEYMALKKPMVQYTLKEGEYSAKKASLYALNTDPVDFAEKVIFLIDNPVVREEMGEYGYNRVVTELSWEFESRRLIDFYKKVLRGTSDITARTHKDLVNVN